MGIKKFQMDNFTCDLLKVFEKHDVRQIKLGKEFIGFEDEKFYFIDVEVILNKPDWYVKQAYSKLDSEHTSE